MIQLGSPVSNCGSTGPVTNRTSATQEPEGKCLVIEPKVESTAHGGVNSGIPPAGVESYGMGLKDVELPAIPGSAISNRDGLRLDL